MRRMKLDLDRLAVESFEPAAGTQDTDTVQEPGSLATTYGPWYCPEDCPCESDPNSC